MPIRISPADDAERDARDQLARIARELRMARLRHGISQGEVARRLSVSISRVSRAERAAVAPTVVDLVRHAAAVGLRMRMAAYPLVRVPLDAPQLALLRALRDRIGERWRWRYEVPIPLPGDLRAADAVLSAPSGTVLVEAETRLVDVQATLRAANLKRRDIGADRLVLLVAGSRANRRALSEAAGRAVDPLGLGTRTTRTVVRQLRAGELPAADAVVLL